MLKALQPCLYRPAGPVDTENKIELGRGAIEKPVSIRIYLENDTTSSFGLKVDAACLVSDIPLMGKLVADGMVLVAIHPKGSRERHGFDEYRIEEETGYFMKIAKFNKLPAETKAVIMSNLSKS